MTDVIVDKLIGTEVMTLTLYGEARGESIDGQVAVCNVIINRFRQKPHKYKSISEVCLEKNQFSCWNWNDPNYPKLIELAQKMVRQDYNEPILRQCNYIANGVAGGNFIDNTHGSTHYMTSSLFSGANKPEWALKAMNMKVIGNHIFFNV
jgi:N-acetylmuramoyl-L-alanine amidase